MKGIEKKEIAMPKIRYYIYDGLSLVNCLQKHLISYLAKKHNFFQFRKFDIIIGFLKIFLAIFLLCLYLKKVAWEEKFISCIIGVIIYFFIFLYESLWDSIIPFYNSKSKQNIAVRISYKDNTPYAQFSFHHLSTVLIFPKLSKPLSQKKFSFPQFFTKGGFFILDDWNDEVEYLIQPIL